MTRLTESQLRHQLHAARSCATDADTRLQVDFFYGTATASHRGATVYAPEYVAVTSHAPGGYVARGGVHTTWVGPLGEATCPGFARRLLRRALAHAYEHLPAPGNEPDEARP